MYYAWPFRFGNEDYAWDSFCTANSGFTIGKRRVMKYDDILALFKKSPIYQEYEMGDLIADGRIPGFYIVNEDIHKALSEIPDGDNDADVWNLTAIRIKILEKCSISTVLPVRSC